MRTDGSTAYIWVPKWLCGETPRDRGYNAYCYLGQMPNSRESARNFEANRTFVICSIIRLTTETAFGGLVVSVLATGPRTEDGGFLWVIKIRRAHFLRRGSKAVGPMS
jgi:hypothetical protein